MRKAISFLLASRRKGLLVGKTSREETQFCCLGGPKELGKTRVHSKLVWCMTMERKKLSRRVLRNVLTEV